MLAQTLQPKWPSAVSQNLFMWGQPPSAVRGAQLGSPFLLRDVANQMIETGDIIAISQAVLLAGTWAWVLRIKHVWPGWREKSALAGFLCATIAVISDLLLIVVLHFRGDSTLASALFVVAVVAGLLLGTAGIVLGFLGKGIPKAAALVWSCLVLISVAITVVATMKAIE